MPGHASPKPFFLAFHRSGTRFEMKFYFYILKVIATGKASPELLTR